VASLSQGRTAAAQCGLFTHKSVPVIFEPPCTLEEITVSQKKNQLSSTNSYVQCFCAKILLSHVSSKKTSYIYITFNSYAWLHIHSQSPSFTLAWIIISKFWHHWIQSHSHLNLILSQIIFPELNKHQRPIWWAMWIKYTQSHKEISNCSIMGWIHSHLVIRLLDTISFIHHVLDYLS